MSTALYRRYRPETFADVIGQEHVTDPLRAALRADRITHAYLFSGPRGCGKTTSARIFARCLNCAEGPTDTPCGTCPSCVELARDGAGSLDVVEMDAASHGGVDDARELRERAAFAPARDRYKIFIIDEAHMVTSQGFNALLKLVEEPPAHVKFVFATTEPEKVIGTIRSRTHHYPFRLVPPERLQAYLEELCAAEGVRVADGVLPLVVRAGGGSVRDSLSVLDQLIAGAQDGEVSYERAVALLGYTHATLLDDVVDALAARDGASLFRVVDRVIDSGHDPRRFAEDLLERIRDLVVIAVSGEHAMAVLRSLPKDQFERMRVQSQQLGPAELSRAGDLVNDALTEMSGATSPRLQLELMCARLLLPGADDAARGHAARLDRIERHLAAGGGTPAATAAGAPAPAPTAPAPAAAQAAPAPAGPGAPARADRPAPASAAGPAPTSAPAPESAGTPAPGSSAGSSPGGDDAGRPAAPAPAAGEAQPGARGEREDTSRPARSGGEETRPQAAPAQPSADAGTPAEPQGPAPVARREETPAGDGATEGPPPARPEATDRPGATEEPGRREPTSAWERHAEANAARSAAAQAAAAPSDAPAPQAASTGQGAPDADLIRRRWPEVLSTLAGFKRVTWALVAQNAHPGEVSGGVLHLAFSTGGLAHTFRTGTHAEALQRALLETLGVQLRIEPVLSQAAEGGEGTMPYSSGGWGAAASSAPAPEAGWSGGSGGSSGGDAWSSSGAPTAGPAAPSRPAPGRSAAPSASSADGPGGVPRPAPTPPGGGAGGARRGGPAPAGPPEPDPDVPDEPDPFAPDEPDPFATGSPGPAGGIASPSVRPGADAPQDTGRGPAGARTGGSPASAPTPPSAAPVARVALADDTPSMDDPDAENSGLVGAPLIERMLGGTIISED